MMVPAYSPGIESRRCRCAAVRYAAGSIRRLVAARKTDCCRHNKDYVGSNPTGENRCLVVKAIKRHLSSVPGRRKTWNLPACAGLLGEKEGMRRRRVLPFSGQKAGAGSRRLACTAKTERKRDIPWPAVILILQNNALGKVRFPFRGGKAGSRISADFFRRDGPQSLLRQLPGRNLLTEGTCQKGGKRL